MFDKENRLREANIAALKFFGDEAKSGSSALLENFYDIDLPGFSFSEPAASAVSFRCACRMKGRSENARLFVSWNSIMLNNQEFRILIARDITREVKLAEEKRLLAEQLAHSQRLESLGLLAGGVAHDFNNYIHAILGHVDVAQLIGHREKCWNEKIAGHLEKSLSSQKKPVNLPGSSLVLPAEEIMWKLILIRQNFSKVLSILSVRKNFPAWRLTVCMLKITS
ncbi:MAG: hypothetical protein IKA87_04375 [Lentisphaeria bacterium]|nr:hypothetical protein [Lentisphaeria bacterium]